MLILLNFIISMTYSLDTLQIQKDLIEFRLDSKSFMDKAPVKVNPRSGLPESCLKPSPLNLSKAKAICRRSQIFNPGTKSAFTPQDRVEHLVDNGSNVLRDIFKMHERNLLSAKLTNMPWSDDYWPIAEGILANRYADEELEYGNWQEQFDWFKTHPSDNYVLSNKIDLLSPAEKYDLLVQNKEMSLSQNMWMQGKAYWDEYQKVEGWMGICHGWAPAAFMLPEPKKKVEVNLHDGTKMTMFPSDIKGLGSFLWATSEYASTFIGGRCDVKSPAKDENGRIIDDKCFDTNPGTWHLSVVNQLGIAKRSMVIDATFDYEVWNQPMYSYNYTYFNPETQEVTGDINKAIIAMENYTQDKFKKYRDAKSKFVVGIAMEIEYIVETSPSHEEFQKNASRKTRYVYDLELDENNIIIGGEWYQNQHPDFLWVPKKNAKPYSVIDMNLNTLNWDESNRLSERDHKVIKYGAENGIVVQKIIYDLFDRSK
jgi:hypothetical protein